MRVTGNIAENNQVALTSASKYGVRNPMTLPS